MSNSKTADFFEEVDPFFNDKRWRLFVSFNYKGTDYGKSINTKNNPDTILNEDIFELMSLRNRKGKSDDDKMKLASEFEEFIVKLGKHHATLDKHLHDSTSSRTSTSVLQEIYKKENWDNLTDDAREFYRTFLVLVTDNDKDKALDAPTLSTLFLNFKKVDARDKKSQTRFCSSLPYLPTGMTNESGELLLVDHLHKKYMEGFTSSMTGGNNTEFTYWENLDVNKFIRNILLKISMANKAETVKTPLDEVYDLANNKTFAVKDGKVVDSSGNPVDETRLLDDISDKNGKCHGTHIKGDCENVYTCLLSGDSKKLSQCLRLLETENMYNIAKNEVKQMNPQIIQKLLDTFSVKMNSRGVIESYLEWKANFESRLSLKMTQEKAIQTASKVLSNKKLNSYIQNMMEVISENPEVVNVLNLGNVNTDSEIVEKSRGIKTSSEIKYFIKPTPNNTQALSTRFSAINHQLTTMPNNIMSNYNLPFHMANVNFGNYQQPNTGVLYGGSCNDETASLEAFYHEVLEELKKLGKDLIDDDKKNIENAFRQLRKNHTQLILALNDLKQFTKLNVSITNGINPVTLKEIKGASNISLDTQISKLHNCINNTSDNQRNLIQTIVSQVLNPMVTLASGSHTNLMRQV